MTIDDLQAGIDDDDAIIRNMERKLGIKKVNNFENNVSRLLLNVLSRSLGNLVSETAGQV